MTHKLQDTVILGIPFSVRTNEQTLDHIEEMIAKRSRNMVVTANLDFIVRAMKDPVVKRLIYGASLVTPDGMPLVWAGRTMKPALTERVAGSDFIPMLLERAARKKYKVFFLGGKEEIARRAAERCTGQFPDLNIVGLYSPPFGTVWEMDNDDILDRINRAQPDILLVAFGNPKQEYWIGMNFHKLNVPVSIGVGGTIDFLSGEIPRAPQWMKTLSLEWIFRLSREPRRLAKRYAIDLRDGVLPLFLQVTINAAISAYHTMFKSDKQDADLHLAGYSLQSSENKINAIIVENCTRPHLVHFVSHMQQYIKPATDGLILDLRCWHGIDSEALSMLVSIDKRLRKEAKHCIIVVGSAAALGLRMAHAEDLLTVVSTREGAEEKLRLLGKRTLLVSRHCTPENVQVITFRGELSNDSAFLLSEMDSVLGGSHPILFNFSDLHSIDTGGLRLLLDRWIEHRGERRIHSIPGRFAEMLNVAGLRQKFVLHSTIAEAMKALGATSVGEFSEQECVALS